MAGLEPWGAVLKMEETHNLFLKLVKYALRESGGLLWPVLYGCLYYYGSSSLSTIGQTLFIVLGIPLIAISVLYPFVWKKYNQKREETWKNLKNKQKGDFSKISVSFEAFTVCLQSRDTSPPTILKSGTPLEKSYTETRSNITKFYKEYFSE